MKVWKEQEMLTEFTFRYQKKKKKQWRGKNLKDTSFWGWSYKAGMPYKWREEKNFLRKFELVYLHTWKAG